MNDLTRVPVFPLPLVACPGEVVPLHIFEPRFKAMMAWCLARQTEGGGDFALVHSDGSAWAGVACLMRVGRILKTYDDGRLDLVAVGRQRCRLAPVEGGEPYPVARAEVLADGAEDWDDALASRVFTAHRRLLALVTGEEPDAGSYAGRSRLSYYVLPTSGLSGERKQQVLEGATENERLTLLAAHLERSVGELLAVHQSVNAIQQAIQSSRLILG